MLAPLAWLGLSGASTGGSLDVSIQGLRNDRGLVRVCVTRDPAHFPRCQNDPQARRLNRSASQASSLHFEDLAPGTYAIAVMHDENGNGRLDTVLGIPREGFGFSRNPGLGFGPPSFDSVRFQVNAGSGAQTIRIRYIV